MQAYDVLVIGAGPGGYVAATRAAQLGFSAAVVENADRLGGTCLRVGCIPSKALLESSHKYEEARGELALHGVQVGSVALDLAAMLKRKEEVVATLCKGIDGLLAKNKIARIRGTGRLEVAPRVCPDHPRGGELEHRSPRRRSRRWRRGNEHRGAFL